MDNFNSLLQMLLSGDGCSFKEQYGLYCPGCGATRALFKLVHFHILSSLLSNPFPVMAVVDVAIFLMIRVYENQMGKTKNRCYGLRAKIIALSLLLWMVFAILRNLLFIAIGYDYLGDLSGY